MDLHAAQSPLDTAQTRVEDNIDSYFDPSIQLQTLESLSRKTSYKVQESEERENELQPTFSNSTLNSTGERDAMFANDDLDYPEGGSKAYLVVFGAFMGLIPCFGLLNSLGAIETYLSANQLKEVKSSTIAWIFSIFLFVNFTSCIFSGTFFDRNGARLPLISGMVLSCGGLFATANCTTVYQFILAFSILTGFGNGTTLSPLVSVTPHYFNKKRGLFTSIASTGGSIGGIIFPIMLRKLFPEVGYAWTMRIFSFVIMACYSLAVIFAKERLPHQVSDRTKVEKLLSYLTAFDVKSFKEWKFLFVTLGCALAELSVTTTSTFYASYVQSQGQSLSTSYIMITVFNAAGIPGRWLTGYLSDKVGRFNVIFVILVLSGITYFVILVPFSAHVGALYAFSVIWGFLTGSIFSLLPVCCGQISKTEEFGRRYSTMYFVVAFATLAGIPIGGAIIDKGTSAQYNDFIIYCAVLSLVSGAFYYLARSCCIGLRIWAKF